MRHARLVVALALLVAARRAAADHPHVYLVVVDGLDARLATPARMPRLFALLGREAERSTRFAAAHAVMPSRTNPNHVSFDAALLGNHGGPGELAVPLVVTGGWAGLRAAPSDTPSPSAVDVAPTIAALLGLRASRRVDGTPVPAELSGRRIEAVLAP